MTATVQLTDTQLAQYTASGLIVVDGERPDHVNGTCDWGDCERLALDVRWSDTHGWLPVCERHLGQPGHDVAPELWRKLTEPCATCKGSDLAIVEVPRTGRRSDGHLVVDHCPNPDCDRGRPVVTLTATCPMEWLPGWQCDGWIPDKDGDRCGKCDRCVEGVVALGRFTIRLLPVCATPGGGNVQLPVVAVTPEGHASILRKVGNPSPGEIEVSFEPLHLDPLPQPGQWAVQFEPVTALTGNSAPARPVNPGTEAL